MRNRGRVLLGAAILVLLSLSLAPGPVDAGSLCVEGTFDDNELKCYLAIHADCTECWVY